MNLSKFTTPKINYLRENLNLTDDEEIVFDMLSQGKTVKEISYKMNISSRTVDNRIRSVKNKIIQLSERR